MRNTIIAVQVEYDDDADLIRVVRGLDLYPGVIDWIAEDAFDALPDDLVGMNRLSEADAELVRQAFSILRPHYLIPGFDDDDAVDVSTQEAS